MNEISPEPQGEPLDTAKANEAIRRALKSSEFVHLTTQKPASDSLMMGRDADGKIWESIGPNGARFYKGDFEDPSDDGGVLV